MLPNIQFIKNARRRPYKPLSRLYHRFSCLSCHLVQHWSSTSTGRTVVIRPKDTYNRYRTPVWSLWSRHSFAVACTISFSARSQFKDLTLMSFFLQCLHSMGNTAASFFYKRLVNTFRTRWQERQLNLWYSPDNGLYGRRLAFLINWMFGSMPSDWKYRYWMLTHDVQWHYSVPFQKCNIIEDPLNSLWEPNFQTRVTPTTKALDKPGKRLTIDLKKHLIHHNKTLSDTCISIFLHPKIHHTQKHKEKSHSVNQAVLQCCYF